MLVNQVRNHLAAATMNVPKEATGVAMPDGNGNFETLDGRGLIEKFGNFSDRMPIVLNGKQYNLLPHEVEFTVEEKTPVPTDQPLRNRTPQTQPTTENSDLSIDLSTLDGIDLDNLDLGTDLFLSYLPDANATDPMDRAGAMYNVPGLTTRQLRDGINFGAGVMSRAMVTHMRTTERYAPVKADYLRRHMRAQLELQLKQLEAGVQNATRKQND